VSVALFVAIEPAFQIRSKSLILKVEATSGIEPEYTVLQFALDHAVLYQPVPKQLILFAD
jgi:hypothetical protein